MADTSQKVPYAITPADAANAPVDLSKFPTALTAIVWASSDPANADVVAADDGLSAVLTPAKAGTVTVKVTAINVKGDTVADAKDHTFTDAVPVVVTLGLAEGTPVAK
jgi:hypothetical protein